ncbi:hypothetical protein AGMMS49546_35530 [Spirochaetia bacterium]|nr:hypothetical protein AGMMS49546_35530 [Spirochaetia bacterium]
MDNDVQTKPANTEKMGNKFLIRIFEWVSVFFLSGMVFLVFLNACLRYFFNTAITESEELARFMFLWIIFMGAMIAYKEGKLVSIPILTNALKGNAKKVLIVVQKILNLFIIVFIFYSGVLYTIQASTYYTQGFRVNFGVIAVALPIMAMGMFVIECMDIANSLKRDIKKEGE